MFFSKQYKEILRKIERDVVRVHELVYKIRGAAERIEITVNAIFELVRTQPVPPSDPFDNLFILARFGGQVLKFKYSEENMADFTVKDDHQDEPFSLEPVTGAKDLEGQDIAADQFTITDPVSSNEAVVSIVGVEGGGHAVHFGGPGLASVTSNVSYNGNVVKQIKHNFTVTTGEVDPASLVGGDIAFPGLTPDA